MIKRISQYSKDALCFVVFFCSLFSVEKRIESGGDNEIVMRFLLGACTRGSSQKRQNTRLIARLKMFFGHKIYI